jgi:6-phosphogluconolactonase
MPDFRIAEDSEALARQAAIAVAGLADKAIRNKGTFTVSLSGGSTPKALYTLLASLEYRDKVDWSRVYFFFGDERNVPSDDERSNYRMVRKALLEPLSINESNVINWITELGSPQHVAEMYDLAIKMAFEPTLDPARNAGDQEADGENGDPASPNNAIPAFDLFLLGLGADGHTASLFPNTKALQETKRLAVENWVPQMDEFRFTMTFPVINSAANVMFLVSGSNKAQMVREINSGEYRPDELPAQRVRPVNGKLIWMLDKPAAAHLDVK